MKKCWKCGETKPLLEFYKNRTKKDGHGDSCKICTKEYNRKYRESHRKENVLYSRRYRENNREKFNQYYRERRQDVRFKIAHNLRCVLRQAVKNNFKSGSAVRDLGCTIRELKRHLESQFQPGMTWENYGLYGWHIDHIKPLSSFTLSDRTQFLEACHYTNLQPLWAKENLQKGNYKEEM